MSAEPRPSPVYTVGFLAAAVLAWLLKPAGPRRPLRVGRREIPELCLIRRTTGHRCPGCGMTRGFVYMFRGRPIDAIRANPLTPLVFGLVARDALRPVVAASRAQNS